jgi:hypothetical protein
MTDYFLANFTLAPSTNPTLTPNTNITMVPNTNSTNSTWSGADWDADVSEVFGLNTQIAICAILVVLMLARVIAWHTDKWDFIDIIRDTIMTLQNVITDWVLILQWLILGHFIWSLALLSSVLLGGLLTA